MKHFLAGLAVAACCTANPSLSMAQECMLGEVSWFAGTFAPRNWAQANGQMLSVSSHQALFSILGTRYGGDGRTTFSLPNVPPIEASRTTVMPIICIVGIYPSRN